MISEKQRHERKYFLGASEIAPLFGIDPRKSIIDVWIEKVYETKPLEANDAMQAGNDHEDAIVKFAARKLNTNIETKPEKLRFINTDILGDDGCPIFAANLDGWTYKTDDIACSRQCTDWHDRTFMYMKYSGDSKHEIIEAKRAGVSDEWGEPGTDEIPNRFIMQVHHQMLCTGFNVAHVAVEYSRFGRLTEEMYYVERNEELINAIIHKGIDFWNNNVLAKVKPDSNDVGDIDIFKRIIRQPETRAEVKSENIAEWQRLVECRKVAEKQEKAAKYKVLADLGECEGSDYDDEQELTYFEQAGRRKIDFDLFAREYPAAYAELVTTPRHRVLRLRKVQ